MVEIVFISPLFLNYILPFVLVWTLIFAILEKTNLLGEGRRQINAIIGLVVGLILIAFPFSNNIVVQLMPFLAVAAVVLLVFMLLYGFISGGDKVELHPSIKWPLIIILILAIISAFLIFAGWWDPVYDFLFYNETGIQIVINILIVVVIAAAIFAVLKGSKGGREEK